MLCKIVVQTNQQKSSSQRFSIDDDVNQTTFTVTINDLSERDKYYWCAIEIKNWKDVRQYFKLSVTTGVSSLYVDQQEMSAFEGGSVTVMCHHKYLKAIQWCRLGTTCVMDPRQSLLSTPVTINESVPNIFSVTMSEMRMENSGWYLCNNKDFQMPVHITVHELPSIKTTSISSTTPSTHQLTSTEPHSAQPTNSTVIGTSGENLQDERKSSTKVMAIIMIVASQLLLVPAAFCGWRMIRRYKRKPEGPVVNETSQVGSASDGLYATIVHNQHIAAEKKIEPADGSVIYSTLNTKT
ncbi:uncharacterized protein LOC113159853 isoform X2 [Anabas testudineus]|nr:uncharacterized protein LOC113159853 isoform X2 [Anabas testudineus]XP_026212590.1 uncharacterized protein LOC113159853 isoform X2 [Anabas testudineus]